jgi:hypothetical protein
VVPFIYDGTLDSDPVAAYPDLTDGMNVFKINSTYITPPNTAVSAIMGLDTGDLSVQNNQNVYLPTKYSVTTKSLTLTYTPSLIDDNNTDVSPVLDTQRVSGLYVQNIIRQVSSDSVKDPIEMLFDRPWRNLNGPVPCPLRHQEGQPPRRLRVRGC